MNKTTLVWIIIAASMIFLGIAIFIVSLAVNGWDFTKFSTETFETNTYDIEEDFSKILLETDTAQIFVVPSEDGKCKVTCIENVKVKHSVQVENNTLTIRVTDTRKWYEHIGISFEGPRIAVWLPETEYSDLKINSSTGDVFVLKGLCFENMDIAVSTGASVVHASVLENLKIKTSTGDIGVHNASPKTLDLSVSTGKIHVENVKCENFTSTGTTGDLTLENVIATEKFHIERNTGDVEFVNSDAEEIFVETSTGDVTGSLKSAKVFQTETNTGRVKVPETTAGGKCEITTNTGDIEITIGGQGV